MALKSLVAPARRLCWRVRSAAVCATLLCLVAGCTPSPEELIYRAQDLQSQDNLPGAIAALRQAVGLQPDNAQARLQLGLLQAKVGDTADAEKELRRALELGVPGALVLPYLGGALFEMQQYRKLLNELALPADMPADELAVLILQRGHAHLALGETTEARTQFLTAANYRPVEGRLGLAQVAAAEDDLPGAEKLADGVIAESPESAGAWLVRGDLHQLHGDARSAAKAYRRAVALDAGSVGGMASEALLLIRAGDYPAARELIERARRIRPGDVAVNFARAVLALRGGDLAVCRESIDRVRKTVPDHPLTTVLDAALLSAVGELEQSEQQLLAYIGRYPSDLYARKLLAGTLLMKRQPEQALVVLTPLLADHGDDPEVLALVGRGELETGLLAAGRDRLKKAAALAPGNARLRTELGLAQLALGEVRAATDELRAAARADSSGFQSDLLLVGTLLGAGDPAAAAVAAGALEAKLPQAAVAYQAKGALRLALADPTGARAAFERALQLDPAYFPAVAALSRLDQRSGATDSARERLNSFLAPDGGHMQANLAVAELEAAAGNPTQAMEQLVRLLQLHKDNKSAILMLAQLQLQSGQLEPAILSAQRALSLSGRDPIALETLARAQRAVGDASAAAGTFSRLSALYPDAAYPLVLLADAYTAAKQRTQAHTALAKAMKLEPDSFDVAAAMAVLYLDTQQWGNARELAAALQRKHPHRAFAYAFEGDVLRGQRDYAGAAKAFDRAIAIEDSGALRVKSHQAHSAAKGTFAPDAELLDWLRRNPGDARTRRYLAAAYLDAGLDREAAGQYQLLVEGNPRDALALNNLAWTLQQLGDARALDYAQRAYVEDPESAPIVDTLGWVLLQQGKREEARRLLTKAVALDPQTPAIRFHRAEALQRGGELAEARVELRRIIDTAANSEYAAKASALLRQIGS